MAVLADERIERVAGLEIDEVEPGAEHAERAQLAAVLVRDEVVRIVGAGPGVAEVAQDLAGNGPAGGGAIRAVAVSRRALEDDVHVVSRERRPGARRPATRGARIDDHVPG